MSKKIFSFDAETNGLWGAAFSIAAIVTNEDGSYEKFLARCPIEGEVNSWVAENVLPTLVDIPITHNSYKEMLKAFAAFYMANKEGADVIVHMGLPVEAKVMLDMHTFGFIGDWDAPYPLIDISAIPQINTSVDAYNSANGIEIDFQGTTHNPLYDSIAAAKAYAHVMGNIFS